MSYGKVARGFPSPMMVKVFTPQEVAIDLLFQSFNATEGWDGLNLWQLKFKIMLRINAQH